MHVSLMTLVTRLAFILLTQTDNTRCLKIRNGNEKFLRKNTRKYGKIASNVKVDLLN